jgi:hypothetical protein
MKRQFILLTSLIALLPCLVHAQANIVTTTKNANPKAASPMPASSAAGYRTHKITDFCTTAPRSEWFDEEEMKLLVLHRGYRAKVFKVSKTNCYEVYGFDKNNHVVEAYFDPISTRLLLQNEVK